MVRMRDGKDWKKVGQPEDISLFLKKKANDDPVDAARISRNMKELRQALFAQQVAVIRFKAATIRMRRSMEKFSESFTSLRDGLREDRPNT